MCLAFCPVFCFYPQPAAALSWARSPWDPQCSSSWSETQTLPSFSGACRSGSAPEQDSSLHKSIYSPESRSCCLKQLTQLTPLLPLLGGTAWCLPEIIFGTWHTQTRSLPCTLSNASHKVTSDKTEMISLELAWLHRESHSPLIRCLIRHYRLSCPFWNSDIKYTVETSEYDRNGITSLIFEALTTGDRGLYCAERGVCKQRLKWKQSLH